ncbi:MAG: HEAT repeat domain-containing protein [Kiritimatiellia bacterium]
MENNVRVRLAAVTRLTDQRLLEQIALSDGESFVRQAAVERIKEQTVISKIALSDSDSKVRCAATQLLDDHADLKIIVLADPEYSVRYAALLRITNQVVLAQVVLTDKSDAIRSEAFNRILYKPLSEQIFSDNLDESIREQLYTVALFANARDKLPPEHQKRIMLKLLSLACVYSDPEWTTIYGHLCWFEIERSVTANVAYTSGSGSGEAVSIEAQFSRLNKRFDPCWIPKWPLQIYGSPGYRDANLDDIGKGFVEWLDQPTLAKFALNSCVADVRDAAVNKLTHSTPLSVVATLETEDNIRLAAQNILTSKAPNMNLQLGFAYKLDDCYNMKTLVDQNILESIVRSDSNAYIRLIGVMRLENQKVLAAVAQTDNDVYVRCAAIEKLRASDVLSKIVVSDAENVLRIKAVKGVTDQAALEKAASHDRNEIVRRIATERLHNQEALAEIARNDPSPNVRLAAMLRMAKQASREGKTDQEILCEMIESGHNKDREISLYNSLIDPNVINRLARSKKHCAGVVRVLTDQEILGQIATTDKDMLTRLDAVRGNLTNQVYLAKVAKYDVDWHIRREAVLKLQDQQLLIDIAHTDIDLSVREWAISKVTNQDALAKIACTDSDQNARIWAINQLNNQDILATIAENDAAGIDTNVRRLAALKLRDQKILKKIASHDRDKNVRTAAESQLRE